MYCTVLAQRHPGPGGRTTIINSSASSSSSPSSPSSSSRRRRRRIREICQAAVFSTTAVPALVSCGGGSTLLRFPRATALPHPTSHSSSTWKFGNFAGVGRRTAGNETLLSPSPNSLSVSLSPWVANAHRRLLCSCPKHILPTPLFPQFPQENKRDGRQQ